MCIYISGVMLYKHRLTKRKWSGVWCNRPFWRFPRLFCWHKPLRHQVQKNRKTANSTFIVRPLSLGTDAASSAAAPRIQLGIPLAASFPRGHRGKKRILCHKLGAKSEDRDFPTLYSFNYINNQKCNNAVPNSLPYIELSSDNPKETISSVFIAFDDLYRQLLIFVLVFNFYLWTS